MLSHSTDDYGKVAVLMGGLSAEREISLQSGNAVLAALRRKNIDAHPIDTATPFLEHLRASGFSRAFIVLHGRGGEDGVIQGALDAIGIPYTGSGVFGSALAMNKHYTKLVWSGFGLPTVPSTLLKHPRDLASVIPLGFPIMLKPVREGSSIGMSRVETPDALARAFSFAQQYDQVVMAEKWIDGTEYTCAILDDAPLPLIRVDTPHSFFDYDAKYNDTTTRYICPCDLPAPEEERLQNLALEAFAAVQAVGWGRVDFIVNKANDPLLLEINTAPGMTDHSLVPMAARAAEIDFDTLCTRILRTTVNQH
jgi:D-alanine-D-alanine ligase